MDSTQHTFTNQIQSQYYDIHGRNNRRVSKAETHTNGFPIKREKKKDPPMEEESGDLALMQCFLSVKDLSLMYVKL